MADPRGPYANQFSDAIAIQAEGGRIGIVMCKLCGAAVTLDPRVDYLKTHIEWHINEADPASGNVWVSLTTEQASIVVAALQNTAADSDEPELFQDIAALIEQKLSFTG